MKDPEKLGRKLLFLSRFRIGRFIHNLTRKSEYSMIISMKLCSYYVILDMIPSSIINHYGKGTRELAKSVCKEIPFGEVNSIIQNAKKYLPHV